MVWFQCEVCGDELKKPKLPNHFRRCSAYKLSCIDCGETFSQQNVDSHTTCITEAEKYGPKGVAKAVNGTKAKNETKQKPEVDINVGLSSRPPWFCSLCNTSATSQQTLLLHAEGKKHRGKARGFHAANQKPSDTKENNDLAANNGATETTDNTKLGQTGDQISSKDAPVVELETDASKSTKKRKHEASDKEGADVKNKTGGHETAELGNGEVTQVNGAKTEASKGLKKAKKSSTKEDGILDSNTDKDQKIKWKKLITTALKSNADGVLKFKKLRKSVMKSLQESRITKDKKQVSEILEQTISASSKFTIDGKHVCLTASS